MPTFRLERLLRVRERVRKLRQQEAADLSREVARLEDTARAAVAARDERAAEETRATREGPIDADVFRMGRLYDQALATLETTCAAESAAKRAALEVKREQVVGARREERKLERLREAYELRVGAEEARDTQRLLDELGGQGRGRRPDREGR